MYYISVKASPKYHQMTLDELLYGAKYTPVVCQNETNTRTYEVPNISKKFKQDFSVEPLIRKLEKFNEDTEYLRQQDRDSLYYHFKIPKNSGGLRPIDAPNSDLMEALRRLKVMFEQEFNAPRTGTTLQTSFYHTSAFAYIPKRSVIDAVKRHQSNESKWFAKLDFSNFFGTTTLDFVMRMLRMVFPFCEICKTEHGEAELRKAVELGFLNGVLPQGTPFSPTITNIMMIPLDFRLFNRLRNFMNQRFVYTRYADDMIISSRYWFQVRAIEAAVIHVLNEFEAPFRLNKEKTRYGSSSGQNWNLGLMLNKDNEITVGWKAKRGFERMLDSYIKDRRNGIRWDSGDLQYVLGLHSYFRMVEGETIKKIVAHYNNRAGFDVLKYMKQDLHPAA